MSSEQVGRKIHKNRADEGAIRMGRDRNVASLDIPMILQAAAGSTVRFEGRFGHPASIDCE
ncbi:MAG: hypothetical protein C4B59_10815 [Candidatus Methanogaster sp.]|uniref:Uncharacterized protein n=1 Tax=Candidatus Methanogaster sp. TaxID=3386292 RepID=A0AC61L1K6_9EURY|nr:MAG: hypothetical protein C4B59_10815 [ANME-2 cluster archaeon]